jgi:hypothetical protein
MSDAAMHVELTKEHQWLEQLVGEWTCEMEAEMSPAGPPAPTRRASASAPWAAPGCCARVRWGTAER